MVSQRLLTRTTERYRNLRNLTRDCPELAVILSRGTRSVALVKLSRRNLLQLAAVRLAAQGMATRTVKPTPRGKPSGIPFHAHVHRRRRSGRTARAYHLWRRFPQGLHRRNHGLRLRLVRLRQRRLAGHFRPLRDAIRRRSGRRHQPPLQEQSGRHVHRCDGQGRAAAYRLALRRLRRRLRQRRL